MRKLILRLELILLYIIMLAGPLNSFAQNSRVLKFIFIPHPRSEDKVKLSVLPIVEAIDFSKFDMIMLGGDLDWYTSRTRASMEYCDSLFNLSSPNTLWTMGNHDLDNPSLIKEFTGRERSFAYYRDSITFLVLDTEINSNGFVSSFINGSQLDMVISVCDTLSVSRFLVVVHHRLLWMIGNDDFNSRIDSVGESTKQLDTTNFYQDIYPLLQKVKSQGIQVICLGGDKSKINIRHSPEDSITFIASTMAPEYADNINDVTVLWYDKAAGSIRSEFIPLDRVNKQFALELANKDLTNREVLFNAWQVPGSLEINIQFIGRVNESPTVRLYSVSGVLQETVQLKPEEVMSMQVPSNGIYILSAKSGNSVFTRKIAVF